MFDSFDYPAVLTNCLVVVLAFTSRACKVPLPTGNGARVVGVTNPYCVLNLRAARCECDIKDSAVRLHPSLPRSLADTYGNASRVSQRPLLALLIVTRLSVCRGVTEPGGARCVL